MSTSSYKLRQYGESHVFLEEITYTFRLAVVRTIEGNIDHNGHNYGGPMRRNIGSRDSLRVDVMTSLLRFQLGRIAP